MFCCLGSPNFLLSDQLPPAPTDEEAIESACALRSLLSNEGLTVRKITSKLEIAPKTIKLLSDGSGLEYTPASKKHRQFLLFSDLYDVSIEDFNTKTYRKANLDTNSNVIVNLRTRSGVQWRLVLESIADANRWLAFIGYEQNRTQNAKYSSDTMEGKIQNLFHSADTDHNGSVSLKEAKKLMEALNVKMDKTTLLLVFKQHDTSGDGVLDINEFTELFNILTDRPDLRPLFEKFAKETDKGMSADEFRYFCKTQNESPAYGDLVFGSLEPTNDRHIFFATFVNYLLDPTANGIMMPLHKLNVVDSMSFSLKDYFINSSHNTYLSGNQFMSGSNVDMYKIALRSGCRCVELDCWDGSDGDPVVYHGYTRTSKIRFSDALQTISQYAFIASPYPVILSLEVHTSARQTDRLACLLQSSFGSSLLLADEVHEGSYTPDNLKHRIIAKAKVKLALDPVEEEGDDGSTTNPLEETITNLEMCAGMVAIHSHDWGNSNKEYHSQSFSENKMRTLEQENRDNFILQNTRMLSRVYPKGSRISSSNYNPFLPWSLGVQMVALNYQTWDEGMRMNDGMFSLNSRSGYVLKPPFLRNPIEATPTCYTLNFTVICGSQIPRPCLQKKGDIVDPYVRVLLNGGTSFEGRTATKYNNGLKPYWNETFVLSGGCLELDLLSVRVMDEDSASVDEEVCEICIPLRAILQGYRALPLKMCSSGVRVQTASLLVHSALVVHTSADDPNPLD